MSHDPFYLREKEKYDNPVASREFLLQILQDAKQALGFLEICQRVNADDEDSRIGIQRRLRAMEREGQVEFTRQKKYRPYSESNPPIKGRVIGHKDGYGFLKRDDGEKDLFISKPQMHSLLHDDLVLANVVGEDRRGREEARILQVVQPRSEPIVGRYFFEHNLGVVIPDDGRLCHEIMIPPEHNNGARQGHVVVVNLLQRPRKKVNAIGTIVEVLGEHMAPGMEIEMALRNFEIPHHWPKAVDKQIKGLSEQVSDKAKQGRIDLRKLPLVTIDGEDARDFDDAVYCGPLDEGGWQLWVAIADVSYYVKAGTALDQEAIARGNSVYFPEQVIPMLPEVLSNGLCSLNPQVDRLCMVCEMHISESGNLQDYQFYEAVMNSHARLTYTKVWNILQGDPQLHQNYAPQVPHLHNLHKLYRALKGNRLKRGAIEFETQENKFVFNAQRKIDHIVPVVRNDAHKMIEECMIMANVSAASMVEKHKQSALFRIHDRPDDARLSSFKAYLGEVGIELGISQDPQPKEFARIVDLIALRPDKELIQTMLLRSMKQAVYAPDNIGHFGLALDAYAHFTSPIRRYPDLLIHRVIKAILDKQNKVKSRTGGQLYTLEEMDALGEQCSMTERRADDATCDVADWLKCEFMQNHVGDWFEGVIASVTHFGFFVRLTEFHIDGLVHITHLDNDYYHFDDVKQALLGETFGKVYRLGDSITVQVLAVHLDERKIDFAPEIMATGNKKSKRKKTSKIAKTGEKKGKPQLKQTKPSKKRGKA